MASRCFRSVVVKLALHLRGGVGYLTFEGRRMPYAHTAKQAGLLRRTAI